MNVSMDVEYRTTPPSLCHVCKLH